MAKGSAQKTIYDYVLQLKLNSHWITLKAMDQEIYQTWNMRLVHLETRSTDILDYCNQFAEAKQVLGVHNFFMAQMKKETSL